MATWGKLNPCAGTRRSLTDHSRGLAALLAGLGLALSISPANAETKNYVVSWFTQATYSQDGDCDAQNPSIDDVLKEDLVKNLGKSREEVDTIFKEFNGGSGPAWVRDLLVNRGRVDGKPSNVYNNPSSEPESFIHVLSGKYAYGFNLDGKGAQSPNSFEDPETHEKGINNQYMRAMGCITSHRAFPPDRPAMWYYQWDLSRDSMPAWLISLDGADLSKDGDVTVTFDRATRHAARDNNGGLLADATFRVDPDPRSHNVLHGTIKGGVLTIVADRFQILGDPFLIPMFEFHNMHMRLTLKPDGKLDGMVGAYEPWLPIYFFYASGGYPVETMIGINMPGVYWALRRLADASPDPKTGQNMDISVAYRIEAIPAFFIQAGESKVKTAQTGPGASPDGAR